jgi:hypothetical protein
MTNYAASLNAAGRYEEAIDYSANLSPCVRKLRKSQQPCCSLFNVGKNDERDEFRIALQYKRPFRRRITIWDWQ